LCSIDVAGSFGRDLSAQGEKAMIAFGSNADKIVRQRSSIRRQEIQRHALERRAVRARRDVGFHTGRPALREGFVGANRLHVSRGEATHETLWGTVDGAWESGERAAEAALRRIGALRIPNPPVPARAPNQRRRTVGAPIN